MNIRKIRIICEEAYAESIWCKQLVGGLVKELKKRRIAYEQYNQVGEIQKEDIVCVIGMSSFWTQQTIFECNVCGCTPLLMSSQAETPLPGSYHLLCPDVKQAKDVLGDKFRLANRTKIALYAVNQNTDLDADKTDIFGALVKSRGDIYPNTGSLENCFRAFLPKAAGYDAVICVNGYAAISLVKKMEKENPKLLENLVIVTFEEVLKHSKYNRWILVVDFELESYGKTALAMIELISGNDGISSMTVQVKGKICEIPEKNFKPESGEQVKEGLLYEDPEIIHMARIEQLLCNADDLDHHIIAMLLDNAKYSEIADSCYMTEGNVKYRVKKYMSICDCKTKKELLELLQEYLQ